MPFINGRYVPKISKKKEEALRKQGLKPFDVRYGVSFPKGGKIKVWSKNKDDAYHVGVREQDNVMLSPTSYASAPRVKPWKKPKHPKTRMKRKNNPRFVPVKIKKVHPKTGKKYTQTIYKHAKEWWKHR